MPELVAYIHQLFSMAMVCLTFLLSLQCLVYFRVEVTSKLGSQQLHGQNCIPLTKLTPGNGGCDPRWQASLPAPFTCPHLLLPFLPVSISFPVPISSPSSATPHHFLLLLPNPLLSSSPIHCSPPPQSITLLLPNPLLSSSTLPQLPLSKYRHQVCPIADLRR